MATTLLAKQHCLTMVRAFIVLTTATGTLFAASLELFSAGSQTSCSIPDGPEYDAARYTLVFSSQRSQFPPSAFDGNGYFYSGIQVPDSVRIRIYCKKDIYGDSIHRAHTRHCRKGSWQPPLPNCKIGTARCGTIPFVRALPSERRRYRATYKHGHTVTYRCRSNERLEGYNKIVCRNGKWSDVQFKCISKPVPEVKGCKEPYIQGAFHQDLALTSGDLPSGTVLTYKCLQGRVLTGNSTLVCNNGKWSDVQFKCDIQQVYQSCGMIPYTWAYASVRRRPDSSFEHGFIVTYRCRSGERIIGDNTIVCENGRWTDIRFRCVTKSANDCTRLNIEGAEIVDQSSEQFPSGTVLKYKCKAGRVQIGNSTVVCEDGRWLKANFKCEIPPEPCQPPRVKDAVLDEGSTSTQNFGTFPSGTAVSFRCTAGMKMTGNSTVVCSNGRWSEVKFACSRSPSKTAKEFRKCKRLSISGARPDRFRRKFEHGSVVQYTCQSGRKLVGNNKVECRNGRWTTVNFFCVSRKDVGVNILGNLRSLTEAEKIALCNANVPK